MANLQHANHIGMLHALVGDELRLRVAKEVVNGTAWTAASGAVDLNLANGGTFLREMTGNITSLAFSNIPDGGVVGASWLLALRIDSTGDYTLANPPSVTFIDGMTWDDLDLTADALNVLQFMRVGDITFAALVWNGSFTLDPYKVCFLENATVIILTENEDIDVANATSHGDGSITFERNGASITERTTFNEGDRLSVICGAATETTTVRIPRYF